MPIPGPKSALRIPAELAVLPTDMDVRQWVALAGLDPRPWCSGTSVSKKAKISKAGNRHLRHALFMPALTATRSCSNVRAFHSKLVNRGKTKPQATVAVMRKLLHAIYGMFASGTRFESDRFHPAPTDA